MRAAARSVMHQTAVLIRRLPVLSCLLDPLLSAQPPQVIERPVSVVWGSYRHNEDLVDAGASQWSLVQQHMDAYLLHGAYWNNAANSIGSPSPDVVGPKLAALVNAWRKKVILEHGLAGLYPDVDSAFGTTAAGLPTAAAGFSSGVPNIKRLVGYGFPVPDISTDYIMETWKQSVRFHPEWTSEEFFTALAGSWETYDGGRFVPASEYRGTYGWFRQWVEGLAAAYPGIRVTCTNSPVYFNWNEGGLNRRELGGDLNNFHTWLKLERRGDSVTALYSGDGRGWMALGSAAAPLGTSPLAGLFVSSLDSGRLAQARFDNVRVLPCYFADIGKTGTGGDVAVSGSTFTLKCNGNEFLHPGNNTNDAQFLAWRDWDGNGTFTVRLDSLANSNAARTNPAGEIASAGLMIRESSAPDSRQVSLLANFANQLEFLARTSTGGGLSAVSGSGSPVAGLGVNTAPRWLRLERSGNTITARHSPDGASWNLLGSAAVAFPSKVMIGLFADSQVRSETATAVFGNCDFLTSPAVSFGGFETGSPGAGSTSSVAGSTYTLKARGTGMAGAADAARLHSTAWTGDGSLVARLAWFADDVAPGVPLPSGAQMGVTLRADASAGAPHVSVAFTPELGLRALARGASGASTVETATYGAGEVSIQPLGSNYRPLLHYFTGNDFMQALHDSFPGPFSANFAGFTTDSPYAGYQKWGGSETHPDALRHREKIILYERWLQQRGREHQFIANTAGGIDFSGFDTATQAGRDAWDLLYKEQSLRSIQLHQIEGGRPDKVLFESWYDGPFTMVPESANGTFTNLVADGIRYLKGIGQTLDLELKAAAETSFAGSLVYQESPAGNQVRTWRPGTNISSADFTVRLTNRGTVDAYPVLHAHETGASGWNVAYQLGGADVSASMRSATGLKVTDSSTRGSELIVPGASVDLTVQVTASSPMDPRDLLIRAFWNPQDPTLAVRDSVLVSLLPPNDPPATTDPAFATTPPGVPVDIDLRTLVSDQETPASSMVFTSAAAIGGSAELLDDGFTLRFIPSADPGAPASFSFTARDQWTAPRLIRHYRFESPDDASDLLARDSSPVPVDGELVVAGSGSATYQTDRPPGFPAGEAVSLRLNEVDPSNHARLRTTIPQASFDLTSQPWTCSFRFKRASHANNDFLFYIGSGNGLSGDGHELELVAGNGAGNLSLAYYDATNTRTALVTTSGGLAMNTWHHAALVWQPAGTSPGTMSLIVNGQTIGSAAFSAAFKQGPPLVFGGINTNAADPRQLNGWLDDVALYQAALAPVETARLASMPAANAAGTLSTGNVRVIIDPTASGLGGHWPFDMDGSDHSGLARHLSLSPSAVVSRDAVKRGSGALDLTNAEADAASFQPVALGETFTLSAWVRLPAGASSIRAIAANSSGGFNANGFRFFVNSFNTTDGRLILETGNGTQAGIISSPAGVVLTGRWQHVAAVVNRASGTATLYRNGLPVASGPVRNDFANSAILRAGSIAGANTLRGSIDDLRLYSRTLAGSEVFQLTAASNTAPVLSTPPSATVAAGTSLGPLAVAVDDAESAAADLVLTATSSDPSLLPESGIALGGSGAGRTLTLTPNAWGGGVATVFLAVSDGVATTTTSFTLAVTNSGFSSQWTGTGTAAPLPWTVPGHWALARPAFPGSNCDLDFFSGLTVAPGTHVSRQERADPFTARRITLGGSSTGEASVTIDGSAISLVSNGAGTPALVLDAAAPLAYRVTAPLGFAGNANVSGNGNGSFEIASPWGGSGGLVKTGTSTLVLTGANGFSGFTDLIGGTLRAAHATALGTTAGATRVQGGSNAATLEFAGGITTAEPLRLVMHNLGSGHSQIRNHLGNNTLAGNVSLEAGGGRWDIAADSGSLAFTGAVSNTVGGSDTWRTLFLKGPAGGSFSGPVTDSASGNRLNLTVASGSWSLADTPKTFTGTTTVAGGRLVVETGLASGLVVQNGGVLAGTGSTTGSLAFQAGARFSHRLSSWSPSPQAFSVARLLSPATGTWTLELDASGLAETTGAERVIPVIQQAETPNPDFGKIVLQVTGFAGSGVWSLRNSASALELVYQPDRYQAWITSAAWNGADASPLGDPDGDGLRNLLEFALGGNPLLPSASVLPSLSFNGGRSGLSFVRTDDPLIIYQVEASGHPAGPWSAIWTSTGAANTAGTVVVEDEVVVPVPPRRFLRLKVSR